MIAAVLPANAGYEAWRAVARNLLGAGVRPDEIAWRAEGAPDLFGGHAPLAARQPPAAAVPRRFVECAEYAALHRDAGRFALLYRVLWRLQRAPRLMEDAADPDIARLEALAKAVRRDIHRMHAFVRFRQVDENRFVAWYEPQHYVLAASADFFVRRFAGMQWSIVTPDASAHWDGAALTLGPGGVRTDVPSDDARDDDWRTYYASMFNPARVNPAAMRRELPKHAWRNLPEARGIPDLVRSAAARTDAMVAEPPATPRKRAGAAHGRIAPKTVSETIARIARREAAPETPDDLVRAIKACTACPLWRDATQAVPPEGPMTTPLLALVGEQPGDQEDLSGRPFIGPAGQVLDRALAAAGIARDQTLVTNAVKHFKHELRGKRRLHKRPERDDVEICRWWLVHELRLATPTMTVALGVTALQALSTHRGSLESARGRPLATREGAPMMATVHPSYLLRLPDEAAREDAFMRFVEDLKAAQTAALALRAG